MQAEKKTISELFDQVMNELKNIDPKHLSLKLEEAKPILKERLADEHHIHLTMALCLTATIPIDSSTESLKLFQERYISNLIIVKMLHNTSEKFLTFFESPENDKQK